MKIWIAATLAATAALATTSTDALATTKHHVAKHHAVVAPQVVAQEPAGDPNSIPLTVNRRSWLDPGPVAPVGTGNKYMTANTAEFIETPDQIQTPDYFGNASLPGQPYVPGRSHPVVEFSTEPNGQVNVANGPLPQNTYFSPKPSVPATDYHQSYSSPLAAVP